LLAIYTGSSVTNLTAIAANDNDGTNTTSRLTFSAIAGVAYAIAVDGFNGASGNIVLQLKSDIVPIIISSPVRLNDGRFQFTLTAEAGFDYDIQATGNMVDWVTIATLPNPTGTLSFIDPNAALYPMRYYRAARAVAVVPALKLTNPLLLGNGQFSVTVSGPTGQVFHLEASTNLIDWSSLGASVTNTTGTVPFTDTTATGFTRRFYRVVVP
jgi:hypothetical protein